MCPMCLCVSKKNHVLLKRFSKRQKRVRERLGFYKKNKAALLGQPYLDIKTGEIYAFLTVGLANFNSLIRAFLPTTSRR